MNKLLLLALLGGVAYAVRKQMAPPPRATYPHAPPPPPPRAELETEEARLDEGLDESFPASDPPSMTAPHSDRQ